MEVETIELDSTDQKFINIKNVLENHRIIVNKIVKINNYNLKKAFEAEKLNLKHERTKEFCINIMNLYHGTKVDWEQLSHEGLDERLSRKGRFGRGIYFSDNPEKSCKYAKENSNSENPFILICKVILGDIKEYADGEEARDLKKEPVKEIVNGRKMYYDSVKGHPKDCTEYVVYDKRRVLIKYIIFFSQSKDLIINSNSKKNLQNVDTDSENDATSDQDDESGDSKSGSDDEQINKITETPSTNYVPKIASKVMAEQKRLALLQLIDMRNKISQESLKELIIAFVQTYGPDKSLNKFFPEIISTLPPLTSKMSLAIANLEPVSQVMEIQIKEFKEFTNCLDDNECKKYLQQAEMNVEAAITLYYEQNF